MQYLLNTVLERIKGQVPELRTVDLNSGQLDGQYGPPIDMPCALVDISLPECTEIDSDTQNCRMNVVVRVIWEAWGETSAETPKQWRGKALENTGLVDRISWALNGWGTDRFDNLVRKSVIPERRADGLKCYAITFSSSFSDER